MTYTDADLIRQHRALKVAKEATAERQAKELKPLTEGMMVIENALLARLIERDSNNTKTDEGTAYKKTHHSYTTKDQEALFAYVLGEDILAEQLQVPNWFPDYLKAIKARMGLLTAKARPEGIEMYGEENDGALPPGIKDEPFVKVHVNKPR